MEIKNLLSLPSLLTLLCPGIVFVYIYMLVITGRGPELNKDNLATFVAASTIYTVAATAAGCLPEPLKLKSVSLADSSWPQRLEVVFFAFVAPAMLGAAYAAARQRDLPFRLMVKLKLSPINPSPSAWEAAVKRIVEGDFLFVTLKDGRQVCGSVDHLASFSSKEGCNDMLLSETDPIEGQPADVVRSTWIASDEIQTLEIVTQRASMSSDSSTNPDGTHLFFRRSDEEKKSHDR